MLGCTVNFLLSLLHSFLCLMLRTIQIFQSLEETESTVKILHPTITPHLLFFCLPPVTVNHCCHFLMCPSRLKKMCTHTHKQIVLSSISYTKERMLCMMCTGGDLSIVIHKALAYYSHFLIAVTNILLYECTIIYLTIPLYMDV